MPATTLQATPERVRSFVDWFIRTSYVSSWIAEDCEACGYSRSDDRRDRFDRVHSAAEHGADGLTHREYLDYWRAAFETWIRDIRRRRRHGNDPDRFIAAVDAYFDDLEAWHEANGSADQQLG